MSWPEMQALRAETVEFFGLDGDPNDGNVCSVD